jgi:hypothetical protein
MNNSTVTEHLLLACSINVEDVLEYLDELHSAASEDEGQSFAGMSETELLNALREIVYTAQEAITELEASRAKRQSKNKPVLQLMPKVERAG